MKKLAGPVIVLALLLFAARPGSAQSSAEVEALQRENEALRGVLSLQKEIEALRDGQRSLQKDLEEIKTLLRSRPAAAQPSSPHNVVLNIAGEPLKGEKTARLTLIEFTDYQ
jgi:hypothetical protein